MRLGIARVVMALTILSLTLLGGCKDPTRESVADDMVGKMKEVTDVLKGVTDESSAKSAGTKLKSLAADMKKLQEQAEKLPKSGSADDQQKVSDKLVRQMGEANQAMMAEMMRISRDPKLSKPIEEAMRDFEKVK